MKVEECEIGRIVLSTQGRDKGRYFAIYSFAQPDHVFITDGKTHKIENPKKKNVKHLKAKPYWLEESLEKRKENLSLENYQIREALKQKGLMIKTQTNEEECTIVQK